MAKMHDEAKDLRLLSKKCRIDYVNKTIQASKTTIIGNNSWGRIDYLTHYCGWTFIWNNEAFVSRFIADDVSKANKRAIKKESKAPKLTNKKKR